MINDHVRQQCCRRKMSGKPAGNSAKNKDSREIAFFQRLYQNPSFRGIVSVTRPKLNPCKSSNPNWKRSLCDALECRDFLVYVGCLYFVEEPCRSPITHSVGNGAVWNCCILLASCILIGAWCSCLRPWNCHGYQVRWCSLLVF